MTPSRPDVLVVGGGPAGSTVAGLLARRGWAVHLLDRARFPRPKPCGECLSPGAVDALERLGLLPVVEALGPSEIRGWDVHTAGGRRAVGRFGPDVRAGLGIARERLDHALLMEARHRGVRVEEGVRVLGARPGGPSAAPRVRTREPEGREGSREARFVVGADGLRSVVARAIDAHRRRPELRKLSLTCRLGGAGPPRDRGRLVLGDDVTVGLAPVGATDDGTPLWNGTVVTHSHEGGRQVALEARGWFEASLARAVADWTERPAVLAGPWASGPFDWPTRRTTAPGVVLVGDAAGYFDPLTGEGVFRALRSAELAATFIDSALRQGRMSVGGLTRYPGAVRRAFRGQRALQRLIEAAVVRPRLREAAVGRLSRSPGAMDALIRVTGDARSLSTLLGPSVLHSLLLPSTPSATAGRSTLRGSHAHDR